METHGKTKIIKISEIKNPAHGQKQPGQDFFRFWNLKIILYVCKKVC